MRHLLRHAEDMRVVLREAAHAHDAVQRAGRLVAVARAELGHADRQIAIGLEALIEDLHVAGAVHRLDGQCLLLVLDFGEEHVLAILRPVPRTLPQRAVQQHRCLHLLIVAHRDLAPDVVFQRAIERVALRVPEHLSHGLFLHVEKVHLAPDLTMVALLRLLKAREIGLKLLRVAPRRAVDALKLRVLRVAPPIGAGDLH